MAYRIWSCTSRYHKTILDRLTLWSLWLAIGGSIGATLAEQSKSLKSAGQFASFVHPATIGLGVVAAAAIALAAFLGQQAQAGNRVGIWTRSRSAAESLKSGILLYRTGAQPFDGPDRIAQMKQRMDKIETGTAGIEPRQPKSENPPDLSPMTVNQYIKERVQDQIDWYQKRAMKHQSSADLCRRSSAVLTGVGVVLTVGAFTVSSFSAWTPVVATMAASITAHLKSQQFQMLTATYSSTALRLTMLLGDWTASGKSEDDKPDRNTFIQRCEETMSNENGGWSALWIKNN
jgi:cation transporter-like permease